MAIKAIRKNYRKDYSAVTINLLRSLDLLVVIENFPA